MSNLKEGWTQRIRTNWTQPVMAPLSSTVSVTIKSQPVNLLQTLQCRHVIWLDDYCFLLNLNRSDAPQQALTRLLLECRYKVKKRQHQMQQGLRTGRNLLCVRGGQTLVHFQFQGNVKVIQKDTKRSISNVDCYLGTNNLLAWKSKSSSWYCSGDILNFKMAINRVYKFKQTFKKKCFKIPQ